MKNSSITQNIYELSSLHYSYSKSHKQLISIIHTSFIFSDPVNFTQKSPTKIIMDSKTLEEIIKISKDLIEIDLKNTFILKNHIRDLNKLKSNCLQLSKTFREDLSKIRHVLMESNSQFDNQINKFQIQFQKALKKNKKSELIENSIFRVKELISRIAPKEVLENDRLNLKQKIQNYLKLESIEKIDKIINPELKLNRLYFQYNFVVKRIEAILVDLLQVYEWFNKEKKEFDEKIIDSKTISNKVSSPCNQDLHKNKGISESFSEVNFFHDSLHKIEMNQKITHLCLPTKNESSSENSDREDPITETRIIPGKFDNILEQKIQQSLRSVSQKLKSNEILNRKRSVNSSVSSNLSFSRPKNSFSTKNPYKKSREFIVLNK